MKTSLEEINPKIEEEIQLYSGSKHPRAANSPKRTQCMHCGKFIDNPAKLHLHEVCCIHDKAKKKCRTCKNAYRGSIDEIGCQCHVYDTLVCRFFEKGKPSTQKTTANYTCEKATLLTRMW